MPPIIMGGRPNIIIPGPGGPAPWLGALGRLEGGPGPMGGGPRSSPGGGPPPPNGMPPRSGGPGTAGWSSPAMLQETIL